MTKTIKYLNWLEGILLILIAIGLLSKFIHVDGSGIISVSLIGLAVIFFLYAYQPLLTEKSEGVNPGFRELLAWSILPKVIWIGSSISVLGIAFYLFHLNSEGYKKMLMIGGSASGIAMAVLGALLVAGVKNSKDVTPILFRAVPLLLVDGYILFGMQV